MNEEVDTPAVAAPTSIRSFSAADIRTSILPLLTAIEPPLFRGGLYGPVFERNQKFFGVNMNDLLNKDQLESDAQDRATTCGLRAST